MSRLTAVLSSALDRRCPLTNLPHSAAACHKNGPHPAAEVDLPAAADFLWDWPQHCIPGSGVPHSGSSLLASHAPAGGGRAQDQAMAIRVLDGKAHTPGSTNDMPCSSGRDSVSRQGVTQALQASSSSSQHLEPVQDAAGVTLPQHGRSQPAGQQQYGVRRPLRRLLALDGVQDPGGCCASGGCWGQGHALCHVCTSCAQCAHRCDASLDCAHIDTYSMGVHAPS